MQLRDMTHVHGCVRIYVYVCMHVWPIIRSGRWPAQGARPVSEEGQGGGISS